MKKNKFVKFRNNVFVEIVRWPCRLIFRLLYGFKLKEKIKLKKNENVFIISNHQTDFDPILINMSFNKPIHFVCTESVFSNKFARFIVGSCFGAIPKKKGAADPRCIKNMLTVIKEKGNICIFPEGNRSYAEFQFHMDEGLAKLIKASNIPLLIFNLHGGTGVMPRFAKSKRKGPYYGVCKKVISVDEYKQMSNEQLLEVIKENLKVYDSESNCLYKSRKRAEYLERMLFVCPCCNKHSTLYSKNEFIYCKNCGLKVEFGEDLHLKSANSNFNFTILNDWYQYQKKWCLETNFTNLDVIFEDENVSLFETFVNKGRKKLAKGNIKLTNDSLIVDNVIINLKDITSASVVGGRKFVFSTLDKSYLLVGINGFNPLKYVFLFNKLDTHMKEKSTDKFFTLN